MHLHFITPNPNSEALLKSASASASAFLTNVWKLKPARNCHVYLTDDWRVLTGRAAPWFYRFGNALIWRTVKNRWVAVWAFAAGVSVNYGWRKVIGIKPLGNQVNQSEIAQLLFEANSAEDKFFGVVIHELTHAFTHHLFLPVWLNEGLAILASELASEKTIMKPESLELLDKPFKPVRYSQFARKPYKEIAYHYAKGYWLTRYLHERHPEALMGLLQSRFARVIWMLQVRHLIPSDAELKSYFLKPEVLTS